MKIEAALPIKNVIQKELNPVLDIQRNYHNKQDCGLQCYGIAQFIQTGIQPTGPICAGERDLETKFSIKFNYQTFLIEVNPQDFTKFTALMGKRPLIHKSVLYQKLDESLKQEADKEITGFAHGLVCFFKNDLAQVGHGIYFFATKNEVIYVDNQWSEAVKDTTYPFFDSLPKSLEFDDYDLDSFNKNVHYSLIGNWCFSWGKKSHIDKVPRLDDLDLLEDLGPIPEFFAEQEDKDRILKPVLETSIPKNNKRKLEENPKKEIKTSKVATPLAFFPPPMEDFSASWDSLLADLGPIPEIFTEQDDDKILNLSIPKNNKPKLNEPIEKEIKTSSVTSPLTLFKPIEVSFNPDLWKDLTLVSENGI